MADEKRIATFEWLAQNLSTCKKGTPPTTKKGVRKDELLANYNVNTSLVSNRENNRLVTREVCVCNASNVPTPFGNLSIKSVMQEYVSGYIEFNRIKEGVDSYANKANFFMINGSNLVIKPSNEIVNFQNVIGRGYMNIILDKIKILTNINNAPDWTLEVKLTNTKEILFDSSRNSLSPSLVNAFVPFTTLYNLNINFHYIANVVSGFTPNYPNSNNQISHHTKLDIYTDASNITHYQKPSDPYDTAGFYTKSGNFQLFNTDFLYFGTRKVVGDYGLYDSAPSGTPNFPRPGGHNGAMDCRWVQDYNKITIDVRATKGVEIMTLGTFTFEYDKSIPSG